MLWNTQKNILQNLDISQIAKYIPTSSSRPKSNLFVAENIRNIAKKCNTHAEYNIFKQTVEGCLGISINDIINNVVEFDLKTNTYKFK